MMSGGSGSSSYADLEKVRRSEEKELFIKDLYRANNILGMSLLVASIAAVLLAMVVYSCFVTLQCMRVTLIKNLLVSIMFQAHIHLVLQALIFFARNENLPDIRCLFPNTSFCETLIACSKYFEQTTLSWLAVISYNHWCRSKPKLNNRFNFVTFSLIGWISPIVPTAVWTGLMAKKETTKCWDGLYTMTEIAILEVSKLIFILVCMTFVALTYANLYHSREIIDVEEVLKQRAQTNLCTVVWFWFTLGHVVFMACLHAQYPLDFRSMTAWTYILTILLSTGGLVAAACLCFLDHDVHALRGVLQIAIGSLKVRANAPKGVIGPASACS